MDQVINRECLPNLDTQKFETTPTNEDRSTERGDFLVGKKKTKTAPARTHERTLYTISLKPFATQKGSFFWDGRFGKGAGCCHKSSP